MRRWFEATNRGPAQTDAGGQAIRPFDRARPASALAGLGEPGSAFRVPYPPPIFGRK